MTLWQSWRHCTRRRSRSPTPSGNQVLSNHCLTWLDLTRRDRPGRRIKSRPQSRQLKALKIFTSRVPYSRPTHLPTSRDIPLTPHTICWKFRTPAYDCTISYRRAGSFSYWRTASTLLLLYNPDKYCSRSNSRPSDPPSDAAVRSRREFFKVRWARILKIY